MKEQHHRELYKKSFLFVFFVFAFLFSVQGALSAPDDYLYSRDVFVNSTVSSTLVDFPVMVNLSTTGLISGGKMLSSCADLTVWDESTLLDYEIENGTCNTTRTIVWVRIPSLSPLGNTITLLYGNPSPVETPNASGVWRGGYWAVYHAGDFQDSTNNSNHLSTPNASFSFSAKCAFGGCFRFQTNGEYFTKEIVVGYPVARAPQAMSTWASRDGAADDFAVLVSRFNSVSDYYVISHTSNVIDYLVNGGGSGGTISCSLSTCAPTLQYYAANYNNNASTGGRLFLNTTNQISATARNVGLLTGIRIGGGFATTLDGWGEGTTGYIDEVRYHSTNRTIDWFTAEYQQKNTVGEEEANQNLILASLFNVVNGNDLGSVVFSDLIGVLTFDYFNITDTGFCVTYTGNGTGTNCTTTGSGASTYFNVSNTTTILGSQTVTARTYQGLLNVSVRQLFTNGSISSFNVTNQLLSNTTTSGALLIPANAGSNTYIKADVAGNYSLNATCNGASLSTTTCTIAGVYDNLFSIGARNHAGTIITNFSITAVNDVLGSTGVSTTNGTAPFALLQGYDYLFSINATGYALANITLSANASTNQYNFTLLTENTFELRFFNETSDAIINNQSIVVQLISEAYANNYSTTNGTLTVSLLTPGSYTIRYWLTADVPRDYYADLTPQSYQNITLYIVDEDISNIYLALVQDQNLIRRANVTVKLMRYYIETNDYKIVEMAKTDTNGQAVLRVVPNIINYKLMLCTDGICTITSPTKFTSSSNTYTISLLSNPLQTYMDAPSISRSLNYNNNTQTYVLAWNDDTNIVVAGCLRIEKTKNGVLTIPQSSCTSGSAGSIIYTITDTNQTSYNAIGYLATNTKFSSIPVIGQNVDFVQSYLIFGLIGMLILLILFLTFTFIGGESGIAGSMILGVLTIFALGAYGMIANSWTVFIGIAIVVGVIIYRLRT
jgi:hypothetical protein